MIRAIYGGSFDPFHNGHRAIIRETLEKELADHLHIVPAGQAPGKTAPVATAADRLEMVVLGLADLELELQARTSLESLETDLAGASYTVDTIETLVGAFPRDTWRIVIGEDALAGFRDWRRPERVLELADLIVFSRVHFGPGLPPGIADHISSREDFAMSVSASDIRKRLADGQDVSGDLPDGVFDFINSKSLYSIRTGA